jgi:hypothetical protein
MTHIITIEKHGKNLRWTCSCGCDPGYWTTSLRLAERQGATHRIVNSQERGKR